MAKRLSQNREPSTASGAVMEMAEAQEIPTSTNRPAVASQSPVPPNPPTDAVRQVLLEVPVLQTRNYAMMNPGITRESARMLRSIADGLMADGHKLKNGREVANSGDALTWLMERIKDNLDAPIN